jgi:hypothetical protein
MEVRKILSSLVEYEEYINRNSDEKDDGKGIITSREWVAAEQDQESNNGKYDKCYDTGEHW